MRRSVLARTILSGNGTSGPAGAAAVDVRATNCHSRNVARAQPELDGRAVHIRAVDGSVQDNSTFQCCSPSTEHILLTEHRISHRVSRIPGFVLKLEAPQGHGRYDDRRRGATGTASVQSTSTRSTSVSKSVRAIHVCAAKESVRHRSLRRSLWGSLRRFSGGLSGVNSGVNSGGL